MAVNDLYSFYSTRKSQDSSFVGKTNLIWLRPEDIEEEDGFNLRDYDRQDTIDHIERLAKAWESGAQMPPLEVKVKDGRCFVRDGHCRLRAARLAISRGAGILRVSVIELTGSDDLASVRLLTSNDSLKLTVIQRAKGYQRLRNMGWEWHEIAREIKTSETNIRESCKMLSLPEELQRMIEAGMVAGLFALKLFRIHGGDEALRLVQEAVERRTAEEEAIEGGQQNGGVNDSTTPAKPKKPVRVSSKHISKGSSHAPKAFMKAIVPHFTELKKHLVSNATADSKSGQVSVSMPKDVYDKLLEVAGLLNPETPAPGPSDTAQAGEGDAAKQLELES